MALTTVAKLKLLVYEDNNRIQFPTLSSCVVCGGITGCSGGRLSKKWINDRHLATRVALLQHGYNLARWEGQRYLNVSMIPFACTCKCDHDWGYVTIGNCLSRWTCRKCAYATDVDSSG